MIDKSGVKSLKLELDNKVSQSYIHYIFFSQIFWTEGAFDKAFEISRDRNDD